MLKLILKLNKKMCKINGKKLAQTNELINYHNLKTVSLIKVIKLKVSIRSATKKMLT